MGKKGTVKKKHQLLHRRTRSQNGGIKVILPDMYNPVMEREIKNTHGLHTILSNTRNIEIVSTSSLNSFVLRLHLDPATILFRSDTLASKKELFSRQYKSLSYSKIDNETDGLPIHEIIIKICLIDPVRRNITLDNFNGKSKAWITTNELENEYNTQRYLYSSMMSISGNPFCPDAFGIVTLNTPQPTSPPTLINILRPVPNINTMLQSDTDLNAVNNYINTHVSLGLRVGIIIMESIPSIYRPIYNYSLTNQPGYSAETYKNLCEGIAAINILSIYRGKMFHLDAHPGNWLCKPSAPTLQQIKEIDFGRVYRIDNLGNLRYFINDTKQNINIYVKNNIPNSDAVRNNFLNTFYIMMGVEDPQLTRYTSEQNLDIKIQYAQFVFETEINNIIDLFRTVELFSKPYIAMSHDERKLNIKIIHRLILISALVDSFYNCVKYNIEQGQISHIYNIILNIAVLNPRNILNYPISIDLDNYNLIRPDKAVKLKKTYRRIYDIIYKYCGENSFPHIRNYERFMEIQRTRAQKAWVKLKHIGAGIVICSSKVGEKVSKCSRVVGNALSYIPGASRVSNWAEMAYDGVANLKYTAKRKSTNAFRKIRSMVSSAYPYEPILPPSPKPSVSPRMLLPVAAPIQPLSYGGYGGRNTRKHRHAKKH